MTDNFDEIFGARREPRPNFAERVTRGQKPTTTMTDDGLEVSGYKPYGFMPSGNVGQGCEVIGWIPGTDIAEGVVFQYRFLMLVTFVGDELLKLMLPDAILVIEGKHLGDLRKKLDRHMVSHIHQFNPRMWPAPAAGEPIIERVELVRPEAGKPGGTS